MATNTSVESPVKAAVFEDIDAATTAVRELRAAGFPAEQISVVCSEEHAQKHFGKYTEKPAGSHTGTAIDSSVVAGLGLSGAAAVSAVVLSGGAAMVAVGAFAGLALTGTLVSLFASRGVEKEIADFHDQALQGGDLLVAVEVHGSDAAIWLNRAEEVFRKAGAKPLALPEG